jgi:membrane protein YdbS with pleckstrin-like domain
MVEEQVTRKRRRRRRRGAVRANESLAAATVAPEPPTRQAAPTRPFSDWQWLTFPVFFAFVSGAFLMLLVVQPKEPVATYYKVLFLVFLAAVAFCLLHVTVRFVRWWLSQRD